MNQTFRFNLIGIACAIACAVVASPSLAAEASRPSAMGVEPDRCVAAVPVTSVDQRIAAKAVQGIDALRQFISITRGIYGLDMQESVARLDRLRAARASCLAEANVTPGR